MKRLLSRLNKEQPLAYAFIRIFLGGALLIRGLILAFNPQEIIELVRDEQLHIWFSYAIIAHILGGLSLTLGLLSRIGALIQVPILLGAVFIVHAKHGFMMAGESLEVGSLVLFLLVLFIIFGSGPLSIDSVLARNPDNAGPSGVIEETA